MQPTLSTAALLLGLASAGFAQSVPSARPPGLAPHPGTSVTYVAPSMAPAPGAVEVRGRGLDLVLAARVNGVEVPILARGDHRLVLTPPAQIPGFGVLELVRPGDSLREPIEFTPSLSGRWAQGRVQLRLHPGAAGIYILHYSFRRLQPMLKLPEAYYGQWLDLDAAHSGVLFSGHSGGEPVVFPWMPVPRGLLGPGGYGTIRPMLLQAWCGGRDQCFSNLLTLQPTL